MPSAWVFSAEILWLNRYFFANFLKAYDENGVGGIVSDHSLWYSIACKACLHTFDYWLWCRCVEPVNLKETAEYWQGPDSSSFLTIGDLLLLVNMAFVALVRLSGGLLAGDPHWLHRLLYTVRFPWTYLARRLGLLHFKNMFMPR